ncbi:MAG: hypothetical protein HC905_05930 [Bacteroidales bacterium]|nr:hypothetical protein [Bacteroidales bacterium]
MIINHIEFQDGNIGEQFILNPKRKFEEGILTADEYTLLKKLQKNFKEQALIV